MLQEGEALRTANGSIHILALTPIIGKEVTW
jgi:hypothetical protein